MPPRGRPKADAGPNQEAGVKREGPSSDAPAQGRGRGRGRGQARGRGRGKASRDSSPQVGIAKSREIAKLAAENYAKGKLKFKLKAEPPATTAVIPHTPEEIVGREIYVSFEIEDKAGEFFMYKGKVTGIAKENGVIKHDMLFYADDDTPKLDLLEESCIMWDVDVITSSGSRWMTEDEVAAKATAGTGGKEEKPVEEQEEEKEKVSVKETSKKHVIQDDENDDEEEEDVLLLPAAKRLKPTITTTTAAATPSALAPPPLPPITSSSPITTKELVSVPSKDKDKGEDGDENENDDDLDVGQHVPAAVPAGVAPQVPYHSPTDPPLPIPPPEGTTEGLPRVQELERKDAMEVEEGQGKEKEEAAVVEVPVTKPIEQVSAPAAPAAGEEKSKETIPSIPPSAPAPAPAPVAAVEKVTAASPTKGATAAAAAAAAGGGGGIKRLQAGKKREAAGPPSAAAAGSSKGTRAAAVALEEKAEQSDENRVRMVKRKWDSATTRYAAALKELRAAAGEVHSALGDIIALDLTKKNKKVMGIASSTGLIKSMSAETKPVEVERFLKIATEAIFNPITQMRSVMNDIRKEGEKDPLPDAPTLKLYERLVKGEKERESTVMPPAGPSQGGRRASNVSLSNREGTGGGLDTKMEKPVPNFAAAKSVFGDLAAPAPEFSQKQSSQQQQQQQQQQSQQQAQHQRAVPAADVPFEIFKPTGNEHRDDAIRILAHALVVPCTACNAAVEMEMVLHSRYNAGQAAEEVSEEYLKTLKRVWQAISPKSPSCRPLLRFMLHSGMLRPGEVINLTPEELKLKEDEATKAITQTPPGWLSAALAKVHLPTRTTPAAAATADGVDIGDGVVVNTVTEGPSGGEAAIATAASDKQVEKVERPNPEVAAVALEAAKAAAEALTQKKVAEQQQQQQQQQTLEDMDLTN